VNERIEIVRIDYDRIAEDYARHIYGELAHKPLDRELLRRFAARMRGQVCDMGCGPGQVARFLPR
jgi:trans-aconitate methyltransferase